MVLAACLAFAACGPGSPGGPSINNRLGDEPMPVGPEIQSNDILARDARANRTMVKHILISWQGRGQSKATRSRDEADTLALEVLERVRAGGAIEPLMAEFSEDPGSATSGEAYEATPSAQLVFEFKRLALRLDVGEAGLVLSDFGWHVIQRID